MQIYQANTDHALRLTIGYFMLFIVLGLDTALAGPNLPALATQTNVRVGQMGFLFLFGGIGYISGTVIGGRIYDRFSGHPIMGSAQIIVAIALGAIPLISWFWLLLIITFIKGFCGGVINTGGNTLLTWTHGVKVAPYMNGLHFCFGVGAFLSPLLVAQFIGFENGYRWAYWIISATAALIGLFIFIMPSSPSPARSQSEEVKIKVNKPHLDLVFILTSTLFLFFYVGAEISYSGWIYTYAFTLNLADATQAAYLTSSFWFSFTLGRLLSIPISTRMKPREIILIGLIGAILSGTLLLFIPASSTILWITTISLGFLLAPIYATGFTLAGQSIHLSGWNSGIILMGDSIGSLVLPSIVGQVLESTGPRAMMALVISSLFGNLLAFFGMLFLNKKRGKL